MTRLKVVTGGKGKQSTTPAWLDEHGAAEWSRVAGELARRGVLTPDLEGLLATYCSQVALVRACDERLAAEGLMITGGDQTPRPHPLLNTKNKAAATVLQLAKRLGLLNATSKAQAPPARQVDHEDPWA